ncbi:hypothetical protein EV426DRAFT_646495 [Tirmania nivea]|nr:hypothetical protein EV426DRAFT_646495 [Tirmania nivea]
MRLHWKLAGTLDRMRVMFLEKALTNCCNINVDCRNQFLSLITITCYDANSTGTRPGPSAQNTGQKPRATSVLQLQNSRRRTAIPALSKVDSEGPDVAQDIVHFNALREAGTEAPTLNTPVRRHQYTREFKLAAITYAKEHTFFFPWKLIFAKFPRKKKVGASVPASRKALNQVKPTSKF